MNRHIAGILHARKRVIEEEQADAKEALLQQTKRMKKYSDARFPESEIGATVRIPLPDVDRAKVGPRYVLVQVYFLTENHKNSHTTLLHILLFSLQVSACTRHEEN